MALRRRSIEDRDLDLVAVFLGKGFPRRSQAEWRRGLERMRHRKVPAGKPRYGVILEMDEQIVGVLLMIFASVTANGRTFVRCNLSSWHVRAPFGAYAPMLLSAALKDKGVTYTNVSPAAHTQATVESQGFRRMGRGSMLCLPSLDVPSLGQSGARVQIQPISLDMARALPEADLVREHLALGCLGFAVDFEEERYPFVFAPRRRLRRVLPMTHLLYCRALGEFERFAGPLGRALVRRGILAVFVDTDEPLSGLVGRRVNGGQNKYVFGPNPPRPGDLAYTELAIFHG